MNVTHNKYEQKRLGAFYTPSFLADYLARTIVTLCPCKKDYQYTFLDPSVGDSILVTSFAKECISQGLQTNLIGIDVDVQAVKASQERLNTLGLYGTIIQTDALYPLGYESSTDGWAQLNKRFLPNGIDFIVCNPPWGADKSCYTHLSRDFHTAKGQYDMYDLFIELIARNLKENGCYAIIVPDSIYEAEHVLARKILLNETTITKIVRLGEGIFSGVNIAVSVIFGIKKISKDYPIDCSHLKNGNLKKILQGTLSLEDAVNECTCKIFSSDMILSGYSFLTDIQHSDHRVLHLLMDAHSRISDVTESHRGVELSKKGKIVMCPNCEKWSPAPRKKLEQQSVKCPHCSYIFFISDTQTKHIISQKQTSGVMPIIVGEDISRYTTVAKSYIQPYVPGINYKSASIYTSPKILVRKTGVGITAGIDYSESLTNQVVYILKRKNSLESFISNEVILAVLCSRAITYYVIKKKGSIGWKTHPYLSQNDVLDLPFPTIQVDGNDETQAILCRITTLIANNIKKNHNLSDETDAEIERLVATLFHLTKDDYSVIFDALNEVQQMIPFKRLLNININDIFKHGI